MNENLLVWLRRRGEQKQQSVVLFGFLTIFTPHILLKGGALKIIAKYGLLRVQTSKQKGPK